MFGTFRFLLALFVLCAHVVGNEHVRYIGLYAVRAFFVISGYAMTAALNGAYRFNAARFFGNRLLRLMPAYVLVCLLTAAAIGIFPREAGLFLPRWGFELSVSSVAQNLAVIPLAFRYPDFRFIEPAWSIAVEFFIYVLLWIGMARTERCAIISLVFGICFHVACWVLGTPFGQRYFSVPSAVLSFSLGASIYFWSARHCFVPRAWLAGIAGAAWLVNLVAAGAGLMPVQAELGGYYLGIGLSAAVVAHLPGLRPARFFRRLDDMLGHLSYPVFLVQWLAAFLVHVTLVPQLWRGWGLTAATVPVALAMAAVLAGGHVLTVEPLRRVIRRSAGMAGSLPSREVFTRPVDFGPAVAASEPAVARLA